MKICKIKWINSNGKPTPHDAPAIGEVYCESYFAQPSHTLPRGYKHERSENYPICAEHAKQLREPGMEHWKFIQYSDKGECDGTRE